MSSHADCEVIPSSPATGPPQVGGGPYNLRQVIKTTPNASPEAQRAAKRRLALEPDVPEDAFLTGPLEAMAPDAPLEGANPFLTGSLTSMDDDLAELDEDTLLSLTSDAPYSLSPSPCATPSPKGSGPSAMLSNRQAPSADPFLEGFTRRLEAVASAERQRICSPPQAAEADEQSDAEDK
ncbi:hypothetical protein H0H92_002334, partial [Tricholoma furcatifolium]